MLRKSIFLAFLISISSQGFLISGDVDRYKISNHSHVMYNEMSYKEIIDLLDDLQSGVLEGSSIFEIKESLHFIKASIEKNISCYYYDQKKVLRRKLLQLNRQMYQLRVCRPRVIFSILTPLTAALSYYYLQDELSTKWKIIVGSIGCMSLMGLADYADFISYANRRLPGSDHIIDIENTIDEMIVVLK